MKRITESQHLALTFTPYKYRTLNKNKLGVREVIDLPRFAKEGEPQKDAIKRLMSSIRRNQTKDTGGGFPKFKPGMTTAEYINLFSIGRNVLPYPLHLLATPAPMLADGPEVIVEDNEDYYDPNEFA